MRFMKKSILLLLIIIPLVVSGVSEAQALTGASDHLETCSCLALTIEYVDYHDLDYDNYHDDFLGLFVIKTVNGQSVEFNSRIHLYLIKPSGYTYYYSFVLCRCLAKVSVSIKWFNTVNQVGWYTFIVCFTTVENDYYRYYEASQMFDPPDQGPPGHPT
ncbi:MAG: hypothetical protein ACFFCZ_23505 [Promethearchaeota archaeon]